MDVIDHIAKEHNLDKRLVEEVVKHQFKYLREQLDSTQNRILLHNLGSFSTNKDRIYAQLYHTIKQYRLGKVSRELTNSRIKRLWLRRNALLKNSK